MQNRLRAATFALSLVVVSLTTSCRGIQIREQDERINALEKRVIALEAKVDVLSKK